jgi:glutamyl-tRNA synthetase
MANNIVKDFGINNSDSSDIGVRSLSPTGEITTDGTQSQLASCSGGVMASSHIRVRFAPSPTGEMHLGNMRTAIVNYLFAKSLGGKFLLRIEDTDGVRSKKEYEISLLDKLDLMGITVDEPIVYQSKNIAYHQKIAHGLLEKKKAYYCQCPSKGDDCTVQITCPCEALQYDEGAIRCKITDETLSFDDFIMGSCKTQGKDVQDFIILRNDGTPTYNLSVVCDDNTMAITHIIRGNDHLSNTFKQVAIYNAMGWPVPKTAHLPLIINMEGKKLSKRDGDISIKTYLKNGFLPETLMSFLVRMGWSYKDEEIFTRQRLLEIFPLGKFQKSSACYNESKLLFQNKHFLSQRSWSSLAPFIFNYWQINQVIDEPMAIQGFDLIKSRCNTGTQLAQSMATYMDEVFNYNYDPCFINDKNMEPFTWIEEFFDNLEGLSHDGLTDYNHLNDFMKSKGWEPKSYQQLLRYALTGEIVGPHLMDIINVLGLKLAQKRIAKFLKK